MNAEINKELENCDGMTLGLPDEATFKRDMQAINRFQIIVKQNLVPELDFGIIPGTAKPTLLKPGAEKIAKLLGLSDTYEIVDKLEDFDKPFFRYLIKCSLRSYRDGKIVSEGLGECNSYEGKYRWRETKRKCPVCNSESIIKGKVEYGGGWICFKKSGGCGAKFQEGDSAIESQIIGRVENEDICSQVNTILKMAKKRALVDASLSAGRLSQIFTQDLEDTHIVEGKIISDEPPIERKLADKSAEHYCTQHKVKYFKTEKMKSWAHPIEGSKDWCYEKPAVAPAPTPAPDSAASTGEAPLVAENKPVDAIPQNVGELLNFALKLGVTKNDLFTQLGVKKPEDIKDIPKAWAVAQQFADFLKRSETK